MYAQRGAGIIYSETIRTGTQLRYAPYVDLAPDVRAFSAMRECVRGLVEVRRELSGVGPGRTIIIPAPDGRTCRTA